MTDNLKTVQELYACFGTGDIPGLMEKMDDHVEWEAWADNSAQNAGVPWMQPKHGKAGVLEFFQGLGAAVRIKKFEVLSIMDGGLKIAAEFVIEAEVMANGKGYRDEEMHLWTFNEAGKVIRLRHYLDTHKHIEVAKGL